MLSNHAQSMFEYLAPRRGGGGAQQQQQQGGAHHQGGGAQQQQQQQIKPKQNEGFKDMVY